MNKSDKKYGLKLATILLGASCAMIPNLHATAQPGGNGGKLNPKQHALDLLNFTWVDVTKIPTEREMRHENKAISGSLTSLIERCSSGRLDVNARRKGDGYTFLHIGATTASPRLVKLALQRKALPSLPNNANQTAREVAQEKLELVLERPELVGLDLNCNEDKQHRDALVQNLGESIALLETAEAARLTQTPDQIEENHALLINLFKADDADPVEIRVRIREDLSLSLNPDLFPTAFPLAIVHQNPEILPTLLQEFQTVQVRGMPLEVVVNLPFDFNGQPIMPIHLAMSYGPPPVRAQRIQVLLDYGANGNEQDENGDTILHLAVREGTWDILQVLLDDFNIDVNVTNNQQHTPLYDAVQLSTPAHSEILQRLLACTDIDVDCSNAEGNTLLWEASLAENYEIVDLLIQNGANVYAENNTGITPFHLVAARGNPRLVRPFLASGADINGRNRFQETPLHVAVRENNQAIVQLLLSYPGIEVNLLDEDGHTALDLCDIEPKRAPMEITLIAAGAKTSEDI
jgi:ankyrin repeat protein